MRCRYIFFLLLFSIKLFSQGENNLIELDANGVTIKCPGADIGYTQIVNGKEYTVVDRASIQSIISNLGDVTCVCTSNINNMSKLFMGWASFDQNVGNWDTSAVTLSLIHI